LSHAWSDWFTARFRAVKLHQQKNANEMRSISYYLAQPFKEGVTKEDVKAQKNAGKPTAKLLNNKPTTIYLFLTFPGRKLVRVNTMEKIKGTWWNFDTQSAKANMYGSIELNDRLQFLKAEVTRQYRKAITDNPRVTLDEIKKLATAVVGDQTPDFTRKPLLINLNDFIEERRSLLSPLTTVKYGAFVSVLKGWMDSRQISHNSFYCDQVNEDFEYSLKQYLIEERRIVNTTIGKYLECLKSFMRWAKKKGLHNSDSYVDFSIKRPKSQIIWLNDDELGKLVSYEPDSKHMRRTRLVFLYMIYTGQRYTDYAQLKRRDLIINDDGTVDWHLFQRKGSKTIKTIVPLLPEAVIILDSFEFRERHPDDLIIPIGSDQYMNRMIKELGRLAGIDQSTTVVKIIGVERIEEHYKKYELLSCHTARKTWVSLSLKKGLSPEYLTAISGHTSFKTVRDHYLGLDHKAKRQALTDAWK
jgi:integrase